MSPDDETGELAEDARRRTDLIGGLLLIAATVCAIVAANTPLATIYDQLLDTRLAVSVGDAALDKPLLLWINDGLMAIFFLLVGLELKQEVLAGQLSSVQRALLPLCAAAGGVVVPVAIYALWNCDDPGRMQGWAIPAATDIAFAIGVLALLGRRVPVALRTFLLSLAVFDDLAAIVIIAAAYTDKIAWGAQMAALATVVVLFVMNRLRVTRYGMYLLVGAVLWVCVLKSGIHATLAGVIVGAAIPRRPVNALGHSPLHQLEHVLRPWVAFFILPVFAFVNAGVALRSVELATFADTVTLGVGTGLLIGKLLGVFGTTMVLRRFGYGRDPGDPTPSQFFGAAALAGIGFTMSLFIGTLAFEDAPRSYDVPIRLGVLGASVAAAVLGLAVLNRALPTRPAQ
ncbi:nhaA [Symbiodinium sp. KB8]|nr:nhaA [Symbiodinium sp. KB8]